MEPRHIIRAAIAASVVGHLGLVVGVYFADARPFDPSITQDIAVDIVTPEQAAEAVKEAEKPPEPEKQPDPFRLPELSDRPSDPNTQAAAAAKPPSSAAQQPASSSAQASPPKPPQPQPPSSQQQASQQPSPESQQAAQQAPPPMPSQPPAGGQPPPSQQQAALQPPAETSTAAPSQAEPDITVKYGVMLGLPDGNGGSAAIAKADIAPLDVTAFRQHLKTCLKLPANVAPGDNVRIVLRAFLAPNGKLITEPMLIEASASAKGPLLMQAAMKGLEACQPYAMLPADKYKEWKVLDLPFTPQDFAG